MIWEFLRMSSNWFIYAHVAFCILLKSCQPWQSRWLGLTQTYSNSKKSARDGDATKRQSPTVHISWNWCNRPNPHMNEKNLGSNHETWTCSWSNHVLIVSDIRMDAPETRNSLHCDGHAALFPHWNLRFKDGPTGGVGTTKNNTNLSAKCFLRNTFHKIEKHLK